MFRGVTLRDDVRPLLVPDGTSITKCWLAGMAMCFWCWYASVVRVSGATLRPRLSGSCPGMGTFLSQGTIKLHLPSQHCGAGCARVVAALPMLASVGRCRLLWFGQCGRGARGNDVELPVASCLPRRLLWTVVLKGAWYHLESRGCSRIKSWSWKSTQLVSRHETSVTHRTSFLWWDRAGSRTGAPREPRKGVARVTRAVGTGLAVRELSTVQEVYWRPYATDPQRVWGTCGSSPCFVKKQGTGLTRYHPVASHFNARVSKTPCITYLLLERRQAQPFTPTERADSPLLASRLAEGNPLPKDVQTHGGWTSQLHRLLLLFRTHAQSTMKVSRKGRKQRNSKSSPGSKR